ncbi:hypothetical protein D915_007051 [Fasciola hepatica]|uniref:Leucine Rich repeat-containing domain protein n=1 Tax=Fasciola hepatica TaxID=6192 RepID=A0A4E0RZ87_FASHE|nr:hypothetical protein D915_007051 [Fasciola hepatica]
MYFSNVELMELILDYMVRDVNVQAGCCTHARGHRRDHPSERLTTSPLGLACRLADTNEKLACQSASLLLACGAFDPEQSLFHYAFQQHHLNLAGLLLTWQVTRILSAGAQSQAGLQVNLSHKRLDCHYIPRALWLLRRGPITDWVFGDCDRLRTRLQMASRGGSASLIRSVSQSFVGYPITRVLLSHCGIQLFPWCLLADLPNLQELDISWNRLGDIPLDPPQLISSPLDSDRSVKIWAPKLIYLDMSHNHLIYLPSWIFTGTDKQQSTDPCHFAHSSLSRQASPIRSRSVASESRICSFQFAPQLTHLMLSHNQLFALPGVMWSSRSLRFLDLSWNFLSSLPLPDEIRGNWCRVELGACTHSSLSALLFNSVNQ